MTIMTVDAVVDAVRHADQSVDLLALGEALVERSTPQEFERIIRGMHAKAAAMYAEHAPERAEQIMDASLIAAIQRHPANLVGEDQLTAARASGALHPDLEHWLQQDVRDFAAASDRAALTTDQRHVLAALTRAVADGQPVTVAAVSAHAHAAKAAYVDSTRSQTPAQLRARRLGEAPEYIDAARVDAWLAARQQDPSTAAWAMSARDAITHAETAQAATAKVATLTQRPTLTVVAPQQQGPDLQY